MPGNLSKFTLMALITSVTLPISLCDDAKAAGGGITSLDEVAIWQGVRSISSDAYLQFVNALFTVYLLPTLSRLTDKSALCQEIVHS